MAAYLITGCSRGLGLEISRQLASQASVSQIFATARNISPALEDLAKSAQGKVTFLKLDVTSPSSIAEAAQVLRKQNAVIDVLINNAAGINWMTDGIDKMQDLTSMFEQNVASVHNVTVAMLPFLQKSSVKKVVNMSTEVGSMSSAAKYMIMKVPSYKISKAALNMLTVQWALSYRDQGIAVFAISPDWIQTDLGTASADLTITEGVQAILDVVQSRGLESTGKFYNIRVAGWEEAPGINQYNGQELLW